MKPNNTLSIKNFGQIKEANIAISPLVIFMGANGSGKFFSSMLLHSLLNPFKKEGYLNQFQEVQSRSVELFAQNNSPVFAEFKESLDNYLMSEPKFDGEAFRFPSDKFNMIVEESFGKRFTKSKADWKRQISAVCKYHGIKIIVFEYLNRCL